MMTTNFEIGISTLAAKMTSAMSQAPWCISSIAPPTMVLSVSRPKVRVFSIGRRLAGR